MYLYVFLSEAAFPDSFNPEKLEGLKLAAREVLPEEGRSRPDTTVQPSGSPVGDSPIGGEGLHPSSFSQNKKTKE